jgi:hypothetical protein
MTNPKTMSPIAVLIQDKKVLSPAMYILGSITSFGSTSTPSSRDFNINIKLGIDKRDMSIPVNKKNLKSVSQIGDRYVPLISKAIRLNFHKKIAKETRKIASL